MMMTMMAAEAHKIHVFSILLCVSIIYASFSIALLLLTLVPHLNAIHSQKKNRRKKREIENTHTLTQTQRDGIIQYSSSSIIIYQPESDRSRAGKNQNGLAAG